MNYAFRGIPLLVLSSMPSDKIIAVEKYSHRSRTIALRPKETPEEQHAREVADRLLGRDSTTLTIDMLQRAVNTIGQRIDALTIDYIVVSPHVRQEYKKLIEAGYLDAV